MYQLTETAIKRTKPGTQLMKLTDGRGLYLHVAPTGGKLWRYAYRFNGKQKLMALGAYPDVSLTEARIPLLIQGVRSSNHGRTCDRRDGWVGIPPERLHANLSRR
jgi:hypothetical protein